MIKDLKIKLLVFLLCIFSLNLTYAYSGKWKHSSTVDHIAVYTKSVPGSGVHAFKAVSVLNAPTKDVLALMRDVDGTSEWSPDVIESKTLKNYSDLKAITYSALSVPWPVSNRDFILLSDLKLDEKNKYFSLTIQSTDNKYKPVRDNFVRASMHGRIYLRPVGKNKTAMVMYAHVDPRGKVPKWIVNIFQRKWPQKYFRSIEKNSTLRKKKLNPSLTKLLIKLERLLKIGTQNLVALENSPLEE